MGGRLLVNTLLTDKSLFSRALVVSAQPLPLQESEARERRSWELGWREKFLTMEWADLEREWSNLSVFQGTFRPERREGTQLREMLGQSLVHWSPADAIHSARDLKSLNSHVEWAFGALDQKYSEVAKDLATVPVQGQITVIENAGHRVPFDAPAWLAEWIVKGS
jgi:pimeloyl-ACP methyl ester carboxylesterase